MKALMKKEDKMSVEDRLASLESDVKYLRDDMTDVKQRIQSLDNGVQNVRADLQSFKTEVAKEFGAVRVSIESLKTSIEKSKLWMILTGVTVIMSAVVTLAHALKLL